MLSLSTILAYFSAIFQCEIVICRWVCTALRATVEGAVMGVTALAACYESATKLIFFGYSINDMSCAML